MHLKEAQGLLGINTYVPCIIEHNTKRRRNHNGYVYNQIHKHEYAYPKLMRKKSLEFRKYRCKKKSHTYLNLIFSNKINNSDYFFLNADNQINQYDAYVIAGDTEEDKLFLETMKSNLESSAFNLRLYIKSRDGPGDFDHQKESEIIMNRYVCLFGMFCCPLKNQRKMPSYPSTEKINKTIDVHKLHYYVRRMDQINSN